MGDFVGTPVGDSEGNSLVISAGPRMTSPPTSPLSSTPSLSQSGWS